MQRKSYIPLMLVALLSSEGDAFSTSPSRLHLPSPSSSVSVPDTSLASLPTDDADGTAAPPDGIVRRRSVLRQTLLAATVGIATAFPSLAHADVTNKVAGSTALRALANIQAQLPTKMLPLAQANDYVGIKQCLREPPFDGLRKNMLVIVRGGEDGPKAGALLAAYKQLIKSLEDIDATASLGMRGRKMSDPFLLSSQYEAVEKALGVFVEVGAEAAGIPLQEGSRQTQVGSIDARSGEVTPRVI